MVVSGDWHCTSFHHQEAISKPSARPASILLKSSTIGIFLACDLQQDRNLTALSSCLTIGQFEAFDISYHNNTDPNSSPVSATSGLHFSKSSNVPVITIEKFESLNLINLLQPLTLMRAQKEDEKKQVGFTLRQQVKY